MPRRKKAEPPVYLPDLYHALRDSVLIGRRAKRGNAIAVAGKIVITDDEQKHTRWNNQAAADQATAQEQEVRTLKRNAAERQASLERALMDLKYSKRGLKARCKERDESGHSVMRLDTLKAWIKEHMPSVLAVATEGPLLRLRFCAAAMRGAGDRAESPNRYLMPPTWITINVDTGIVEEARSDGSRTGAMHPHARADNGGVCTGKAIRQPRDRGEGHAWRVARVRRCRGLRGAAVPGIGRR